jgi:hypothetical protein
MAKRPKAVKLRLDEPLRSSRRQAAGFSLPVAVHHRLERLAAIAWAVQPTHAELVGMLIAEAALDEARMEQAIISYRRMTVGDVVDNMERPAEADADEASEDTIMISLRGPGRPSRR